MLPNFHSKFYQICTSNLTNFHKKFSQKIKQNFHKKFIFFTRNLASFYDRFKNVLHDI